MINSRTGFAGGNLLISPDTFPDPLVDTPLSAAPGQASAVLAGGCFWCVEAVYKSLEGVTDVRSGYAGGTAFDGARSFRRGGGSCLRMNQRAIAPGAIDR